MGGVIIVRVCGGFEVEDDGRKDKHKSNYCFWYRLVITRGNHTPGVLVAALHTS